MRQRPTTRMQWNGQIVVKGACIMAQLLLLTRAGLSSTLYCMITLVNSSVTPAHSSTCRWVQEQSPGAVW